MHPVSDQNPLVQLDARQLSDLIRQLPAGFQTIFNLYAIVGYTHIEIGQLLGISDGTSKSQYARARYLLIEWIEKYSSLPKKEQYAGK
ncbi:RNA polymerase sigma factor [Ferruginibacter sp.]|uniref:RNA polymerase sigma factor n=1 Tax=Ferruginibacter sp. TaxID=1940288 RepID=UPI00374CA3C1